MNDIERLLAIEEIKRLKARYFYAFDHKDWTMWREQVFAPGLEGGHAAGDRGVGGGGVLRRKAREQAAVDRAVHRERALAQAGGLQAQW